MFSIVCTGGIGSGKSYTIKIFEKLGVPAYVADKMAKELYNTDLVLLSQMAHLLGDDIVENGVLRRDIVASKIFPNPHLLEKVNSIVHPRVLNHYKEWQSQKVREGFNVVIFESAIFFESPVFYPIADCIVVVTAPEDVRVTRVVKRDKLTPQQVYERISRQSSDSEKLSKADFVIFADGKKAVLPQIMDIIGALEKRWDIKIVN